jgi:hypothetical protein
MSGDKHIHDRAEGAAVNLTGPVWICLGETDEWHPFCPFATRHEAAAKDHATWPGHWCVEDTDGLSRSGLWAEHLRDELRAREEA